MPDIVDKATRSRMMSTIRGKNTRPEIVVRREMHRRGFRYRLHAKELAGKPDIVFPRFRAVVLINGCFWHGHDCPFFKLPSTNPDFWRSKIERNRQNDEKVKVQLNAAGWRIAIVWECALRGKRTASVETVANALQQWLESNDLLVEIRG
ncbi:DNA mismatch endonuclease Vsr [Burkholderia lata]|uniref:very short patch repair endonuclease n=1 Tax=Burkholderia lata (strain ATCC 17760 / DSM 23089 / LMG 22485 / NCIMB 9086 / R18194 / 383) TaxID=482957 RepID=UPI0014547DEE|nr:very short patch repair endonuclease [Burkholderia lata]VWC13703.1 DNA mismatch endonuclease Vsr [Burkholderia lata]